MSQHFSMFMDAQKMQAVFQHELPDCLSGNWQLTGCQIQHPRYKTYMNPESRNKSFLAAAYHLQGINQPMQQPQEGIVYVKAYLGERSQTEYEKARASFQDNPQHAPMLIEKYGMVTWFFPYDPAFPELSIVMDTERMRAYFTDGLFGGQDDYACGIKAIAVQIINYRPEIRCTYRYDFETNSGLKRVLFGKTFADGKGAEIYRRILMLHNKSQHQSGFFALPNPLAYDGSIHTLWMDTLSGSPLLEVINAANAYELITQTAQCLVDFHCNKLDGLATISEEELLAEIEKKSAKLQVAFPALAARFAAVIMRLTQQKQQLPPLPYCLIHGDFHIQQLMCLADQRIALFDFDELALANPLVDLANFSADLYNVALEVANTQTIIIQLFKSYQSASGFKIRASHFDWYFRVQLLTRAYRAFIQRKTDNAQVVEKFLQLAEQGYFERDQGLINHV